MIAVGMMDRIIELHVKSADVDDDYGGLKTYRWAPVAEKTFAHVIWKSGEVNEAGEQMQNKQICEFYVRNSGAFANANVEDMIVFDSPT